MRGNSDISEFAKGCIFMEEEIRDYIDRNKETIESFKLSAGKVCKKEVLDVEKFLEFLDNM